MGRCVWVVVAMLALAVSPLPGLAQQKGGEGVTITVCWAAWPPAELLETLSKDFTKSTGIKVKGLFVPWGDFQAKVQTEMQARDRCTLDLVVLDSQWLGGMVEGGHMVELTDWLHDKSNIDLDDYYEATLKAYGEYPPGSGHMYAVTCEQDMEGLIYRKDLFENPNEKAKFKENYGYELAVPETWEQLRDMAEFFYRPDDKLYGLATKWSRDYDVVTWDFAQLLWAYGGDFWDPETRKVEGIINSPASVKALTFYRDLSKFAAPGAANFSFDQVNVEMQQGRTAMAIQGFVFFAGFIDPEASKTWDKVGFAAVPAGPKGRFVSLGGQGIGVTKYSKHKEEALKFIDWFQSKETQWQWARGGGLTSRKSIVNDPKFLELYAYNKAFRDSLPYAKDIWNVPEYAKLLDVTQENLNKVITGELEPKEALDKIAERHEKILGSAKKPEPPVVPRPFGRVFNRNSVAVVIGITKYTFLGNVPGCREDARAVAQAVQLLGISPENVVVMTDESAETDRPVEGTLQRRIAGVAAEAGKDGVLFLYFSGHGVTRNGQAHLIPQNGDEQHSIPLSDIVAELAKSKARSKVLVVDACRAQADWKGPSSITTDLKVPQDVAVFFSCGEGEKSWLGEDGKQSVYAQFFVKALDDAAAEGGKGLTARSLQDRIDTMMRAWRIQTGKKQTPQLLPKGSDVPMIPPPPQ